MFAEDTVIIVSNQKESEQVVGYSHNFERVTGQRINWDKTGVTPSGDPPPIGLAGVKKALTGEGYRHLGIPAGIHIGEHMSRLIQR